MVNVFRIFKNSVKILPRKNDMEVILNVSLHKMNYKFQKKGQHYVSKIQKSLIKRQEEVHC